MLNKVIDYYFVIPQTISLLSLRLENFVNVAEIQVERIERARKVIKNPISHKNNLKLRIKLFADMHFYFVCIGQINNILLQINIEEESVELQLLHNKFKSTFKKEIRDDLEHQNERAVGKKKGKLDPDKNRMMSDFFNIDGDSLSFGGKKYEVSKNSLIKLKQVYEEFILILHDNYAKKDPEFIDRLTREKEAKKAFNKLGPILKKFLNEDTSTRP